MNSGIWLLVIFLIVCGLIIYIVRIRTKSTSTNTTTNITSTTTPTNTTTTPTTTAPTTAAPTTATPITTPTMATPTTATTPNTAPTNNTNLQQRNNYLEKVKAADENIFNYIRCINIPRVPSCFHDPTGTVCRSRQIDCNKFKLVLQNDPVAVERMKIATDQYTGSNGRQNLSDLTNPVNSGWMF